MSALLNTGWGIFLLSLVACALVVVACTVAATAVLALLLYAYRLVAGQRS